MPAVKKIGLLFFLLALFSLPALGQNTQVSGTVIDPQGVPYASGTGHINLVCPGNQQPQIGTSPIPRSYIMPALDGNGSFSVGLFDVNVMTPAGCGYQFAITDACQVASFTTPLIGFSTDATPITGPGPVDESTEINAAAVPVSSQCKTQQGGGLTLLTLASSATPAFNSGVNTAWKFTLNQNVTSSSFTTTGKPGTIFQFDFLEGAPGGFTFTFPGNVVLPANFSFDTVSGHHTQLAFIWDGSTWNPWQVIGGGGGGGGGTPGSPVNSLQKNCSGAFCGSNLVEAGSSLTANDDVTVSGSHPLSVGGITTLNADERTTGPNPNFNILNYGGYIANSQSLQTMTCSVTATSNTLSCTSNPDFANGHGIVVPLAGAGPSDIPTAPTGTATPFGVTNGTTGYCYKYVLENYFGALTAAGSSFCTATGAATLGVNTVAVSNITRTSGVDTYTCGTNCNVSISAQVQLSGFSGGGAGFQNGTVVVASTPDATHFTALSSGASDTGESASATMSVKACNRLFPSGTLGVESRILRTWVYRQDGGVGNFNLKGVAPGQDPYFEDCNQGVNAPGYVPTTAPASSQVGYLATTIASGGLTNTMTMANAAVTTASSQTVQHDNSSAVIAAWTAAYAAHGGVVLIPVIPGGGFLQFPFNSTMDLTAISNPSNSTVKLMVSNTALNQPWILARSSEIEGISQTSTSFQYTPLGSVAGGAQPLFLANNRSVGGIKISKIKFATFAIGQSSIVLDQKVTGGGEVGFILEDNGYSGISAPAVLIKGGFDFWFTHGVCGITDPNGGWGSRPCVELTSASSYLSGVATQVPGRIWFDHTNFSSGVGISINNIPGSNQSPSFTNGGADLFIHNTLFESVAAMPLRISYLNGSFGAAVSVDDLEMADQVNGLRTPMVDMTDSTNFANVEIRNSKSLPGSITLAGGYSGVAAPLCSNNLFSAGCGKSPNQILLGATHIVDGAVVSAINGGSMGYSMPVPPVPASCVVSAGGSVPIGVGITFGIAWTDRTPVGIGPYAGVSLVGPACSVTTSSGQQTVTITRPAPPVGATGWLVYRGSSGGGTSLAAISPCGTPIPISTTTFVDTFGFTCGASVPQLNTALQSGININGMNTQKIVGGGFFGLPTAVSTTYTAVFSDRFIKADPTGGPFTVTLVHGENGHWITITNVTAGANLVTVQPDSGTILTPAGPASSVTLAKGVSNDFWCDTSVCYQATSNAGASSNVNNCTQNGIAYYPGPGTSNSINCFTPAATQGTWLAAWVQPTAAVAVPTAIQLGVPVNAQTTNYTLVGGDRTSDIRFSSCTTPTLTLPATFLSNYPFRVFNGCTGTVTLQATSPNTINGGAAGGTLPLLTGWIASVFMDNSGNWFVDRYPDFTGFNTTCTVGVILNAATGWGCGVSGPATAGGSNTQFQWNNATALAGTAEGTYNSTNGTFNWTQKANGNDMLILQRFTDTAPTGNFLRLNNAAGTLVFNLDINGNWFTTSFGVGNSGARSAFLDTTGAKLKNNGQFYWSSTSNAEGSADTGLSRESAGIVDAGNGTQADVSASFVATGYAYPVANNGSTATVLNKLAILTGAPSTATVSTTGTTSGIIGIVIARAGTTGSALVANDGIASCIFDGATTAGDYVQNSTTTGGDCHDAGASFPLNGSDVIGRVLTTNGGGGTFTVALNIAHTNPAIFKIYQQAAACNNATAGPNLDLPTTNAPTPNCLTGTNAQQGTLDYADGANSTAQWEYRLPSGWTGNLDITLDWLVTASGGSNAVKWTIATACSAPAATYDTAFNAAQTITTNVGSNNNVTESTQTALTLTGCAAGNILHLKIGRDVTDTFTGTARLYGFELTGRVP